MSDLNTGGGTGSRIIDLLFSIGKKKAPKPTPVSSSESTYQEQMRLATQAQQSEVVAINLALQQFDAAALQVAEPVLRAEAQKPRGDFEARRNQIAFATKLDDRRSLAFAGPGLRKDIAKATQDMTAFVGASTRIATHRTETTRLADEAKLKIDAMLEPGALSDDHADLANDPSTTADAATVESVARDREGRARGLLIRATEGLDAEEKVIEEQAKALELVDEALRGFEQAALQVPEPVLRGRAIEPRAGLEGRRNALAKATAIADRKSRTGEAAKLVQDIGDATRATTGLTEASQRIAAHRVNAEKSITEARGVIGTMFAPPSDLESELQGLAADASTTADADNAERLARERETAAADVLDRARKALVDEADALQKAWEGELATRTAKMQLARNAGFADTGKLEAIWSAAITQADAGAYGLARKLLARFDTAAATVPTDLPAPKQDRTSAGEDMLAARQQAKALLDTDAKAVADAITTYGADPPTAWGPELERIRKSLDTSGDVALTALQKANADAKRDLGTLLKTVTDLTGEKKIWTEKWRAYEVRRVSLAAFTVAGSEPILTPFNALQSAANLARGKTTTHDFSGAVTDLGVQTAMFDALFKQAGEVAHFNAIRAHRAGLVAAQPGSYTDAVCNTELTNARDCLTQADAKANTERKFDEAVALLERIPKHLDAVYTAYSAFTSFNSTRTDWNDNVLTPLKGAGWAKYLPYFQTELTAMTKVLTDAEALEGTNIIKAYQLLLAGTYAKPLVVRLRDAAKLYVDKTELFDPEFEKVRVHPGRKAIEEFWLRIQKDKLFFRACADKREFAAANAVLDTLQPLFVPQLAIAQRFVTYDRKKTSVTEAIKLIRDSNTSGTANAELEAADAYLTSAAQLEVLKKYDEAEAALDEALVRANAGKTLLQAMEGLAALKPGGGMQQRVDAFPGMKSHVANQPNGAHFTTLINTADAPYRQAVDAMKDPADEGAAGTALDQAEAILRDALVKIGRKGPYDTHLAAAQALRDTTLPGRNADNCIDAEIQKIAEAVTEAETAAADPRYDFGAAEQKLAAALILGERADKKVDAFNALKADRTTIANLLAHISGPTYQPALDAEKKRIEAMQDDIVKLLDAFKFEAATKRVAEAVALDGPYRQLCTDFTTVGGLKTACFNHIDNAKLASKLNAAGQPLCQIEITELTGLRQQVDRMFADRAFLAAKGLLDPCYWAVQRAQAMVAWFKEYTDARNIHGDRLKLLRLRARPPLAPLFGEIDTIITTANGMAAIRDFQQAKNALLPIKEKIDRLATLVPLCEDYVDAHTLAAARMKAVDDHPKTAFVAPLREMIQGNFDAAEAMAVRHDYAAGTALLGKVKDNCDAAIRAADSHTPFGAVPDGQEPDEQALRDAIAKVKELLRELRTLPGQQQLPGKILEAEKAIAQAEQQIATPAQAKVSIETASAACGVAEVHRRQFVQIEQEMAAALLLVDGFTGGSHAAKAFVAQRMADNRKVMAEAITEMSASGSAAASKLLRDATTTFYADKLLADRRAEYDTLRRTMEPQPGTPVLDTLEQSQHRYAMEAEIQTLRTKLGEAAAAADAATPDFDKAMAALRAAEAAVAAAQLSIKMRVNDATDPPTPDEVKKILAQPDGDKKIDALVAMGGPDAKRAILTVAFEARFGCKLQITGKAAGDETPTPDIQRFYENMAKLPEKHTLKNDSILTFDDDYSRSGSDYGGHNRKLNMREGAARSSSGYMMGGEAALGTPVDPKCLPANDDVVQYFDWNTLHEAGHAVDDKYRFMASRSGQAAFGGWTEYGRDVRRVAEKLVAEFDYDRDYIQALLSKVPDPAIPEPKSGVDPVEWERRRVHVKAWVEAARSDNAPWETNSTAQRLKLKSGEIIHEAYDWGSWVGYLASERGNGVTGYQFRSPLEWFSELYAAFHSGKLKQAHPAYTWLNDLKTQNVA